MDEGLLSGYRDEAILNPSQANHIARAGCQGWSTWARTGRLRLARRRGLSVTHR